MPNPSFFSRPPLALIVTSHEWSSMTFASVLTARGYYMVRCFQGSDAYRRLGQRSADLLIILSDLWDASAEEVCRTVRDRGLVTPNTPILIAVPGPLRGSDRTSGLQAGAWDVVGLPVDVDQLMLRVDLWVRAKLYSDTMVEAGLLHEDGQLYNARGVLRRLTEVSAGARRLERPLACIVLRAESPASEFLAVEEIDPRRPGNGFIDTADGPDDICRYVAGALKEHTRASDAIGRLTGNDFIVIAPDTDRTGAVDLARRLKRALDNVLAAEGRALRIRAACYAINAVKNVAIYPDDVIARTAAALQDRDPDDGVRIVGTEAEPFM